MIDYQLDKAAFLQINTTQRSMNTFLHKSRLLKLAISLVVFGCDVLRRSLMRMVGMKPRPSCVVLYYHDVPQGQRQKFAKQMDMVMSMTIPISTSHRGMLVRGKRYCAVTFDDGFENSLKNAVPELAIRMIPATFFVTAGYINRKAEWWPISSPEHEQRIACVEKWLQLPTDLIEIGSHTMNHPNLPEVPEHIARAELLQSRRTLEKMLKREIVAFSFPYGALNPALVSWCYEAGYTQVFSTLPADRVEREGYPIGRTGVEPSDWNIEFRLKLLGAYRWMPSAIVWKRKIRRLFNGDPKHSPICTA